MKVLATGGGAGFGRAIAFAVRRRWSKRGYYGPPFRTIRFSIHDGARLRVRLGKIPGRLVLYGCNANGIPLAFQGIQFSWRSQVYSLISTRRGSIPSYRSSSHGYSMQAEVSSVLKGIAEATQNVV